MALSLSSNEFIAFIKSKGFVLKHTVGSHQQYVHAETGLKITVKHPVKDIQKRNLSSMLRQGNLNKKELIAWLGRK